jgi:hypothetical protein
MHDDCGTATSHPFSTAGCHCSANSPAFPPAPWRAISSGCGGVLVGRITRSCGKLRSCAAAWRPRHTSTSASNSGRPCSDVRSGSPRIMPSDHRCPRLTASRSACRARGRSPVTAAVEGVAPPVGESGRFTLHQPERSGVPLLGVEPEHLFAEFPERHSSPSPRRFQTASNCTQHPVLGGERGMTSSRGSTRGENLPFVRSRSSSRE